MIQFLLLSLAGLLAHAAFTVPGFELVVTSPVETKLTNDDLRGPTEVWVELIKGAKRSLDFGEMYASGKPGEPLDQVLESLEAAGHRGVKIRFMLEEKMLRASDPATIERLRGINNLELRVMAFGKISPDGITHAKYFVVDGERAYLGSQNFDWRSLKHIHETGLVVNDSAIAKHLLAIFNQDWRAWESLEKGRKVSPTAAASGGASSRVMLPMLPRAYLVAGPKAFNPKGVVDAEAELVRLIGLAEKEVRIQLLDYAPLNRDKTLYPPIDNALRAALARKVKVKLLVSHWNTAKPAIDHLKSLAVLPGAEVRIVTIPRAQEGRIPFARVNHSKIMTIDGRTAWIGTSNWSGGYFDKTRSVELVVNDEKLAARVGALHEQLWASEYAAPVELTKDYPQPDKGE